MDSILHTFWPNLRMVTVVVMLEMSLDDWIEKSGKRMIRTSLTKRRWKLIPKATRCITKCQSIKQSRRAFQATSSEPWRRRVDLASATDSAWRSAEDERQTRREVDENEKSRAHCSTQRYERRKEFHGRQLCTKSGARRSRLNRLHSRFLKMKIAPKLTRNVVPV